MATLTGISPVLLVSNLERSVAYYRDQLGFECEVYGDPPDFAVAVRDQATILLALCDEPARIVPNWQIVHNIWNAYIRVDDVDSEFRAAAQGSTTRSTTRRTGSASSASRIQTATTSPSDSPCSRQPYAKTLCAIK